jgi:hypothetical protein
MSLRNCFVLAVAGESHVAAAGTAIRFLKHFTRCDIVVLQTRSAARAPHDQVVALEAPASLDNHQASIWLKTNLMTHVRGLADRFCYLDSDVIAVNEGAAAIFDHRSGPVDFAPDNATIDAFSPWAIHCDCEPPCGCLRQALATRFGEVIDDGDWRMWNGGVFLFDEASEDFLRDWHTMTCSVMDDPFFRTRDQGTLAATVWRHGLERQALLDSRFNLIVDCMRRIPPARRPAVTADQCPVRDDYALGQSGPSLIHFINGGVGRAGWRNWDDVARLLPQAVL